MGSNHGDYGFQLDMFGDLFYSENNDKLNLLEEVVDGREHSDFELEQSAVRGGSTHSEPAGTGVLGGSGRSVLETLSSEVLRGTSRERDVGRRSETDGRAPSTLSVMLRITATTITYSAAKTPIPYQDKKNKNISCFC